MNTLLAANISCLQQGIDLLGRMPVEFYARKCPDVFNSSIGGHIRHNLDHYIAFVQGEPTGSIDYDARQREPGIEEDPLLAIEAMKVIREGLVGMANHNLDGALRIRMDDGGDSTWSQTTLRRELQFLLSHTIHHYALVVSIATRYGISDFPAGFGIAPSTLHYMERKGA